MIQSQLCLPFDNDDGDGDDDDDNDVAVVFLAVVCIPTICLFSNICNHGMLSTGISEINAM